VSDGGSDNSLKGLLSDFTLLALGGSLGSTSAVDSSSSAWRAFSIVLTSSSCDDASPSSALPFELPRLVLVDEDCSGYMQSLLPLRQPDLSCVFSINNRSNEHHGLLTVTYWARFITLVHKTRSAVLSGQWQNQDIPSPCDFCKCSNRFEYVEI